jgi:hypothetical protein
MYIMIMRNKADSENIQFLSKERVCFHSRNNLETFAKEDMKCRIKFPISQFHLSWLPRTFQNRKKLQRSTFLEIVAIRKEKGKNRVICNLASQ